MTERAVGGESCGDVIGAGGSVEVRLMARVASGRRSGIDVVHMASRARQSGVRAGQRVAGELQVIELSVEPRVHGVTALARGGESRRNMIQNRCLKILLMAGVAGRREAGELPCCGVFVTVIAL